jgi:hypothetical protein
MLALTALANYPNSVESWLIIYSTGYNTKGILEIRILTKVI